METRACGTESCCQEKYGKHQCSTGKCILLSQKCDGINNCGNGEDEYRSNCPNLIYSGQRVAFRNTGHGTNNWLSCYCTVNCGKNKCELRTCPGNSISGDDWNTCHGEVFRIVAKNRGYNDPIMYHD